MILGWHTKPNIVYKLLENDVNMRVKESHADTLVSYFTVNDTNSDVKTNTSTANICFLNSPVLMCYIHVLGDSLFIILASCTFHHKDKYSFNQTI